MFWLDISPSLRVCQGQAWQSYTSKGTRYIWARVRILHETDKAILVDNGMKIWIPKSRIHGIRLMKHIPQCIIYGTTVHFLYCLISYGDIAFRQISSPCCPKDYIA